MHAFPLSFNSKATEAKDAEDAAKDAEQRVLVLNAEVLEAERKSQAALANLQAEVLFFFCLICGSFCFFSLLSRSCLCLSFGFFWIKNIQIINYVRKKLIMIVLRI